MAHYSDLFELAQRNSAYLPLYVAAIDACANETEEQDVYAAIEAARSEAFQIQSPGSVLDILVRHGAVRCNVYADDVLYEGTLQNAQEDDTLPEDASICVRYIATDDGRVFAAEQRAQNRLAALFVKNRDEIAGFKAVLLATAHAGKTTAEIQSILKEQGLIAHDERGVDLVHASYFTSALQDAGALAWNKGAWTATEEGEAMVV